jgi:uncharacterized glyoxalase superfamily protein PhnB
MRRQVRLVHLAAPDIDGRYKEIANVGAVLFPLQRAHWATQSLVAKDPDGNLIAFEQTSAA